MSDENISRILKEADSNKCGKINYVQYLNLVFNKRQRNQDYTHTSRHSSEAYTLINFNEGVKIAE